MFVRLLRLETPSSGGHGDLGSKKIFLILGCNDDNDGNDDDDDDDDVDNNDDDDDDNDEVFSKTIFL